MKEGARGWGAGPRAGVPELTAAADEEDEDRRQEKEMKEGRKGAWGRGLAPPCHPGAGCQEQTPPHGPGLAGGLGCLASGPSRPRPAPCARRGHGKPSVPWPRAEQVDGEELGRGRGAENPGARTGVWAPAREGVPDEGNRPVRFECQINNGKRFLVQVCPSLTRDIRYTAPPVTRQFGPCTLRSPMVDRAPFPGWGHSSGSKIVRSAPVWMGHQTAAPARSSDSGEGWRWLRLTRVAAGRGGLSPGTCP